MPYRGLRWAPHPVIVTIGDNRDYKLGLGFRDYKG